MVYFIHSIVLFLQFELIPFILFYCFSPSIFQCFLLGAYHTESCLWSIDGGAVLWMALVRVARVLYSLVWSLLSAWAGGVPVSAACSHGP